MAQWQDDDAFKPLHKARTGGEGGGAPLPLVRGQVVGPDGEGNSPNDAHCQQQGKHEQDEPVHLPFHPAALAWGQRCIHHHLSTIYPHEFHTLLINSIS